MRERLLVSACLLGTACRYDGASRAAPGVERLLEKYELVPVCPEQLGGLPTPRKSAECRSGRVVTADGDDVTEQYRRGAEETLRLAKLFGCRTAVLKERSPSCGCGKIYDGAFTRTLTDGDGVAAALLRDAGIRVLGETGLTL